MTQTATHTPGPWTCGAWLPTPDDVEITAPNTDNGDVVATVAKSGDQEYDDSVVRANARVIAAAPDLLAACELCSDEHDHMPAGAFDEPAWLSQLRAAIAKAMGE